MDSKPPQLGGFAMRPLRHSFFAVLLMTASCSRYPKTEAAQVGLAGERAPGGSAGTFAANLASPNKPAVELAGRMSDSSFLSQWNRLVQETIEQSARERRVALIINKYRHILSAYQDGYRMAEYVVDLGSNPFVPKTLRGDQATPEGKYEVVKKLAVSETRFHGAFIINYPNAKDHRAFRSLQRQSRQRMKIGGDIAIQGGGGQHKDWTRGSIALDNDAIDELFPHVVVGTPVTIVANETVQPERKLR